MSVTTLRSTAAGWKLPRDRSLLQQVRPSRTALYCDRAACDGAPHGPWTTPHARGDQLPSTAPVLLLRSGRGAGKGWAASSWVSWSTRYVPEIAIVAPSHRHLREICVEGQSGVLAIARRLGRSVVWEPSRGLITFDNGAKVWTYSAEDEDRLRGGNFGAAWLDEPAIVPHIERVWEVLRFSVRVGTRLRYMLTTTPRPSKWMREISSHPGTELRVVPTHVNAANLSPDFLATLEEQDPTTRLYRQEILGQILEDVAGALLTWAVLDETRVQRSDLPDMVRVLVGVDPSGGSSRRNDETGIVVVGLGADGHLYVLEDASGRYTANEWAHEAWRVFDRHRASAIVAEKNYGGDMVEENLRRVRGPGIDRVMVVNSRISKIDRAIPIAGMFEQGRAHLVGSLAELEVQLTGWVPGDPGSPDRLDAFVHAARELAGATSTTSISVPHGRRIPTEAIHASKGLLADKMLNGLGIFDRAAQRRRDRTSRYIVGGGR